MENMSVCSQCGALVANVPRHIVWHQDLLRAMSDAVVTRDELDYLRDEILDGHPGGTEQHLTSRGSAR